MFSQSRGENGSRESGSRQAAAGSRDSFLVRAFTRRFFGSQLTALGCRRSSYTLYAALCLLALITLACSIPAKVSTIPTSGSIPYWGCATPTAVPTEEIVLGWVTPVPAGSPVPVVATTTPVPTATPYYRLGEFYAGQGAVVGDLQISLVSLSTTQGYTLARLVAQNHGLADAVVPLSALIFASDPDGNKQWFDAQAQAELGRPSPSEIEARPIAPGGQLDETLALSGAHDVIGLNTHLFAVAGGGGQALWFHGGADPVPCPHGAAAWPVPAPRAAGYAYTGALPPPRPDVAAGPYPIESYVDVSQPYGCVLNDREYLSPRCALPARFHSGIDLSTYAGTPVYAAFDATVLTVGWDWDGYGNYVVLRGDLPSGQYLFMYYGHLLNDEEHPILVSEGDIVSCGQALGYVGSTGNSTGPHLHLETRLGDDPADSFDAQSVDPEYMRGWWTEMCQEPVAGDGSPKGR
jgi:murein DD-endopeptidase MepM/ murein hydrolase activator NlpD